MYPVNEKLNVLGSARLGLAWLGSARPARLGSARPGSARLGSDRLGSAWLGSALSFEFFAPNPVKPQLIGHCPMNSAIRCSRNWARKIQNSEPNRAEPRRAEPSRAGPGPVGQAEPSRAGPSLSEPSQAEPSQAGPGPKLLHRTWYICSKPIFRPTGWLNTSQGLLIGRPHIYMYVCAYI